MNIQRCERIGAWLCGGILFVLTLLMVKVEMTKGYEVLLYSDFATHSTWATGGLPDPLYDKFYAYPLWHLAVRGLNRLLPVGREYAGALVTAMCIGITAVILWRYLYRQLRESVSGRDICLLTIGLLILTALYMPWFNKEVYLGQSSPTIWHNPTNMAVKPVALLAVLFFLNLYAGVFTDKNTLGWTELLQFAGLCLLSCFVKPSFLQGFLPAVMVFLFIELICTQGKSLAASLKFALAFLPSGCYFLVQYISVFGENAERGIAVAPFSVMRLDTAYPLISILQSVAFPLFVLAVIGGKRLLQDKPLLFSVCFYVVSLLEFILLIEVNEPESGNFEWALQLALFILFIITAVRFFQQKNRKRWVSWLGKGLFFYHTASGIYYYFYLLVSPLQC